jgi:hypothetical protein
MFLGPLLNGDYILNPFTDVLLMVVYTQKRHMKGNLYCCPKNHPPKHRETKFHNMRTQLQANRLRIQ